MGKCEHKREPAFWCIFVKHDTNVAYDEWMNSIDFKVRSQRSRSSAIFSVH